MLQPYEGPAGTRGVCIYFAKGDVLQPNDGPAVTDINDVGTIVS